MFDFLENAFVNRNRYKTNYEAVIISCFYNPENNPYRLLAFQKWYKSIKHLNYRIYECLIGDESKSQLPKDWHIRQIKSDSLLWHKETLLNKIVKELPDQFKYVFWIDADVMFTNKNWLVEGVKKLRESRLIQPFEYCVHLDKNQSVPNFNLNEYRDKKHPMMWRSFCANYKSGIVSNNYDTHGHVGFAWGARREILEQCPLYDRALIGGADHIIAHAAVGQIPHNCITKTFHENIEEVHEWSHKFNEKVESKVDYVKGDLYHLWHGDLKNRQYYKRITEFTPKLKDIKERDKNGLFISDDNYVKNYYHERELTDYEFLNLDFDDAEFLAEMGYSLIEFISKILENSSSQDKIVDDIIVPDNDDMGNFS